MKKSDAKPTGLVTFTDVISDEPFSVDVARLQRSLEIDVSRLGEEIDNVLVFYAEAARAQRAAEYAAGLAEAAYRAWKSARGNELRAKADKVTVAQIEDAYRANPDYDRVAGAPARAQAVAGYFADLKAALAIKAQLVRERSQGLQRLENFERFSDRASNTTNVPPMPPPSLPPLPPRR